MERLGELQTLLAIVDGGSLSAAARRLRRSPSAVTRTLAELESRTGTVLVDRSTRHCRATPAGARLAAHARGLLAGYEEALAEAAGETLEPSGVLRVSAPTVLGRDFVAPSVRAFLGKHSGISIDLQLSDSVVDLVEDQFDMAVRIGASAEPREIARKLGQIRVVVVASPSYLEQHGAPMSPTDLTSHVAIQHSREGLRAPWTFNERGRRIEVAVDARFCVNQPDAAIVAARDGGGLVRVLDHQIRGDLSRGVLIPVLQRFEPHPLPVNLIWPESRRRWRRTRLLVDHLVESWRSAAEN